MLSGISAAAVGGHAGELVTDDAFQVLAEESACIVVDIRSGANTGYQFKTHPNIDKQMYSNDNRLGLKDPDRPFPTGSPLGILKWRMQVSSGE